MLSNYSVALRMGRIAIVHFLCFILLVFLFVFSCSSEKKRMREAKEHYVKGRKAYLLFTPKSLDEAINEYEKAVNLNTTYAPAYAGLGEAYSFKGLLEEQNTNKKDNGLYNKALKYSQKAVELSPNTGESHRALASAYRALGRFDDAKREVGKAIELNPNDSEAYYILWTVTGADTDSKYIKKAIELNPNLSVAYNDLGYVYYTRGKYEKAAEYLRRAIEINPDLVQAHTNLGLTLVAEKRFDEAQEEYRKAIQIDPNYLIAHYNLGVVLGAQNRIDEAIDEFKKAIGINPSFPEAHLILALAYESKGDRKSAKEEYQKFVNLASVNKSRYGKLISEAENRIKKLGGGDKL